VWLSEKVVLRPSRLVGKTSVLKKPLYTLKKVFDFNATSEEEDAGRGAQEGKWDVLGPVLPRQEPST